jgi:hypothetical protein
MKMNANEVGLFKRAKKAFGGKSSYRKYLPHNLLKKET